MPSFYDLRSLPGSLAEPLAGPIAARYGRTLPGFDSPSMSMAVELAGPAIGNEIWDRLPSHSAAAFLGPAARVSVALQTALRAWLPYVWFSQDLSRFEDFDRAGVLLMYSACRPFTPKSKDAFVFDVFNEDTPRAMHYSISRTLRHRLEGFETALSSLGISNACRYAVRRADRMLELLHLRRHQVNSLLVAERDLVESFLDLAIPHKRGRALLRTERVLRKLFAKRDFSELTGVFEWEAGRALADVLGSSGEFSARIFANSVPVPPLRQHEDDLVGPGPDLHLAA